MFGSRTFFHKTQKNFYIDLPYKSKPKALDQNGPYINTLYLNLKNVYLLDILEFCMSSVFVHAHVYINLYRSVECLLKVWYMIVVNHNILK